MNRDKEVPFISVIIPAYNVEDYLEKCVRSVLKQTLDNIEILIINDGSTDSSQQIIDRLKKENPDIIKAYLKENGGLSSARNYALDLALGEYITFLDSDDYLDNNYLEILYQEAKAYNSDLVISGQRKVSEDDTVLAVLTYRMDKNPSTILRRLNISGKIYKREYIEKHHMRFAKGKTYEDDPFNLIMLFLAKNLRIVQYEGYNQLVRDGSITSKKIDADRIPYEALEYSIAYVTSQKELINSYDIFEYTVLSFFTYFIFQANKKHVYLKKGLERKSDLNVVLEFCGFTKRILTHYMSEYYKNKNVKILKNLELQLSQRCGVWLYTRLCKWNLLERFVKLYYKF